MEILLDDYFFPCPLGKAPVDAAIDGTKVVARGVLSSFVTTLCIFVGLLFLNGDIGQNLRNIPMVLISVISVSLVEAFLILPHHLKHSLEKSDKESVSVIREKFTRAFNQLHEHIHDWVEYLIRYRYAFIGSVIGLLFLSVSLLISGIVKFSAFPDIEGDMIQARILMPVGSSLAATEKTVQQLNQSLAQLNLSYKEKYGENLVDAKASFDPQEGHAVSFRFDTTGAQKFGKATSENVGKRFAVILDGVVITAPVINTAITGGSGIITGNFSSQEAADLSVLLRAGALPAPLSIIEERSVGPGLGADSIASGKIAAIIGMICVCIFMILIYGVFGLLANLSLLANLFIIVSLPSIP